VLSNDNPRQAKVTPVLSLLYSTVIILRLSLNFGQFDKPVAYKLQIKLVLCLLGGITVLGFWAFGEAFINPHPVGHYISTYKEL